MGLVVEDDGWRVPDELWAEVQPLIPPGKPHPLGCHNPRVDDRDALNAMLLVLRTGCQWEALTATGLCSRVVPTVASRNGLRRACSANCGAGACWPTTSYRASSGSGRPSTAR